MDKLLMYLGEDLVINDKITVHQPSIIDIARHGEKKYFNTIYTLCSIPSDFKSELWDMGYTFSDVGDFECFILLTRTLDTEDTRLILGDVISLKNMVPVRSAENGELVLLDKENEIIIDEFIYDQIVEYLREVHGIRPKRERAANKETLEILIAEDRTKKLTKKNEPDEGSFLLPLISSMVNSPGFKYDIEKLKTLGIYSFMDSVQRIQAISTANSISQGLYSGMVDMSKNKNLQNQLNWLRDLSKDKHHSSNVTVN